MYGKPPLRMKCPLCGVEGEHHVISTDPAIYRWSDETTPMFELRVGQDISYRKRSKQCSSCGDEFSTVEMSEIFLKTLINEMIQAQRWRTLAMADFNKLDLENKRLEKAIHDTISALSAATQNNS